MSGWEGLHNHEAHESLPPTEHEEAVPACLDCQSWCSESNPCRCCLAAEVERLRAAIEAALYDHVDVAWPDGNGWYQPTCEHCDRPWPCPTVQALGGDR